LKLLIASHRLNPIPNTTTNQWFSFLKSPLGLSISITLAIVIIQTLPHSSSLKKEFLQLNPLISINENRIVYSAQALIITTPYLEKKNQSANSELKFQILSRKFSQTINK